MKIRVITGGGGVDVLVGEYSPEDALGVIELFRKNKWLDDEGTLHHMKEAMIVVHDFMEAHIEIVSND